MYLMCSINLICGICGSLGLLDYWISEIFYSSEIRRIGLICSGFVALLSCLSHLISSHLISSYLVGLSSAWERL